MIAPKSEAPMIYDWNDVLMVECIDGAGEDAWSVCYGYEVMGYTDGMILDVLATFDAEPPTPRLHQEQERRRRLDT